MKILVTGATGFIGARLCKALADESHGVVALSRDRATSSSDLFEKVYSWPDPIKTFPPQEAFDGVDAVIHLAGESVSGRWTVLKKRAIRESRVLGTRNLVSQIAHLKAKPHVLISASAIGYYGDRRDEVLSERSGSGSDFLSEVCREWEAEAQKAKDFGVRVVQLRIGVVLGKGGGALSAMLLPFKLGAGGPLGSGRQWWSWIHIDDVVGLMLQALNNKSLIGPVNATAPNPVIQREFARTLGSVLHRPAFLPTPAFAVKLLLGEFSSELLSSKRVLPERAISSGYSFRYPDLELALTDVLGK